MGNAFHNSKIQSFIIDNINKKYSKQISNKIQLKKNYFLRENIDGNINKMMLLEGKILDVLFSMLEEVSNYLEKDFKKSNDNNNFEKQKTISHFFHIENYFNLDKQEIKFRILKNVENIFGNNFDLYNLYNNDKEITNKVLIGYLNIGESKLYNFELDEVVPLDLKEFIINDLDIFVSKVFNMITVGFLMLEDKSPIYVEHNTNYFPFNYRTVESIEDDIIYFGSFMILFIFVVIVMTVSVSLLKVNKKPNLIFKE